jgi:hypothetical protein
MELVQQILNFLQALPTIPKIGVSVLLTTTYAVSLIFLWQKASPLTNEKNEPAAIKQQLGDVTSTGQSGGVTAGTYINQAPPVTEQQKTQALLSLESELKELARYPERKFSVSTSIICSNLLKSDAPLKLYEILNRYYEDTIIYVEEIGGRLSDYKRYFYRFEVTERETKSKITVFIGQNVEVRFQNAWNIYLRYAILRSSGFTREQIIASGNFLNYDITWNMAEGIYKKIVLDKSLSKLLSHGTSDLHKVVSEASAILASPKLAAVSLAVPK